jgi:iron(III) transport system substrate-binding protein
MSRYFRIVSVLAILIFVLGACGNGISTQTPTSLTPEVTPIPTATIPPQKLTIACGAQEDWCQAMTKAFQAETGIETDYVRLSSGDVIHRIENNPNNPEFDIWHGGPADGYNLARNKGLLESYISPNAAVIPERYKDKNGYWTGVYRGALGFCSNQKLLDKTGVPMPQSWDDLLDPRLKDLVAMAHPATSGTAYTTMWTLVTLNEETDKEAKDMDKTFAYFIKLDKNILVYPPTGVAPPQMAGRGEVAVGISFAHDCVKYYEEGMKDLVVSFPKEGTGYEIGGVAIIKNTRNLDAAKKYVDWALTAKAQEIPATVRSYQRPTNPDAKIPPQAQQAFPDDIKLVDYDFEKSAAHKDPVVDRFKREIAS